VLCVGCLLFVACWLLSAACCLLPVGGFLCLGICYLLFIVCCLLFVRLVCIAYCLLSVVAYRVLYSVCQVLCNEGCYLLSVI